MELLNICAVICGLLVCTTTGNQINDIWSVRSYDNFDVVEIEKQFETDWNSLQDPLDWASSDFRAPDSNNLDSSTEEETYTTTETEDTSTEDENLLFPSEKDSSSRSEDSTSTSEEYDSTSYSVDNYEDSSDITSEESSDSDSESFGGRIGRRRYHGKGQKKTRKPWMKRKEERARKNKRRFRNPHGSKEQVPHPPKTGRWYRVWQRFNSSKPAREGRWAAMYNRTRGYWNRDRNGERIKTQVNQHSDSGSPSKPSRPEKNWARREHKRHHHKFNRRTLWNHTHHNHNHTFWNRTMIPRYLGYKNLFRNVSSDFTRNILTFGNNTGVSMVNNQSQGLRPGHKKVGPSQRGPLLQNQTMAEGWLEHKVFGVCRYLASPRHNRYVRHRMNTTGPRDFRLEFADQMSICCQKEYSEKLVCFRNLTRSRIDEFCLSNSSVPFRPWKLGQNSGATIKIKPKCCLAEGAVRYDCFNRTHALLLKNFNTTTTSIEPKTEEVVKERRILGIFPVEKNEEEPPVRLALSGLMRTNVQNRRQMRRRGRNEQRSSYKSNTKATCCRLGREYGAELDEGTSVTGACNRMARRLSQKYRPKIICHMAMGRCCINEARNPQPTPFSSNF